MLVALALAANACATDDGGAAASRRAPAGAQEDPPDQATVPLVGGAPPLPASAVRQIAELVAEKRSWNRAQRKIASGLLLETKRGAGAPLFRSVPELRSSAKVALSGRVEVDIDGAIDAALLGRIRALGGRIQSSFPALHTLRAEVPLVALEELAADERVQAIQRAGGYTLNKVNTSQGDVTHLAASARGTTGLTGSGVKVGVMSNGVDTLSARVASGDLPSGINVISAGSGDEGTAMLEIVYDLAPGAELLFATANGGEAQFAQNILKLRDAGANVIVDDIFYYAEGSFQDDIVAQAVEEVTSTGVVYLSSAGNGGNVTHASASVWEGDFLLSASQLAPINSAEHVPTLLHDFSPGQYWNPLVTDPTGYITLEWSDPLGNAAADYDLFLMNASLTTVLDASMDFQGGFGTTAFEIIDSTTFSDTNNRLVVARYDGDARFLRLNANAGAQLGIGTVGQVAGHAAAAGALAVAAVNVATASGGAFVGGATNPIEPFSADGPRRVFYQANGTPLTPGNVSSSGGVLRSKPDLAAADGVTTATPGFSPFFGTSAAAPHAAAIAALLREQHPTATVAELKTLLTGTALDIEGSGSDRNSGRGIVMANRSLANCTYLPNGTSCDDNLACTTGETCENGLCVGTPVVCNDNNGCTDDSCDQVTGCVHTNNTAACSDGSACTTGDVCSGGSCHAGSAVTCNDNNGCTDDSCNPSTGCVYANNASSCSDGNACTTGDQCSGGSCQPSGSLACNDGNGCTDDSCSPASGCVFTNNTAPCSDGNACTISDVCGGGTCTGQAKSCPPSDECHTGGACAPDGSCSNPPATDGTRCTGGECQAGVCTPVSGSGGTGGGGTGGSGTGGAGTGGAGTGGTGESGAGAGGEAGDGSGGTGAEPSAGGSGGSLAGGAGRGGSGGRNHGGASTGATGGTTSGLGGAGETSTSGGTTSPGGTPAAGGRGEGGASFGGEGNSGNESPGGRGSPSGGQVGAGGRLNGGAGPGDTSGHETTTKHQTGCDCALPSRRSEMPWSAFGGLLLLGAMVRRRPARRRSVA